MRAVIRDSIILLCIIRKEHREVFLSSTAHRIVLRHILESRVAVFLSNRKTERNMPRDFEVSFFSFLPTRMQLSTEDTQSVESTAEGRSWYGKTFRISTVART